MKKGFPADTKTVGGRVRKARLDAGYTIKDFAAHIDVSPNHLGLVERGEKQASFKLLQKIAEVTETPYQWIIKGGQRPKEFNPVPPIDTTENLNLRLFLGLILTLAPTINKEALASLLNIPVETMDAILCGENVAWDSQWPSQFPVLAGLLGDIPTVRKDLKDLDEFLADIEFQRNMNILKENLIQFLWDRKKKRYKLYQPINSQMEYYTTTPDFFKPNREERNYEVTWTMITLYETDNPKSVWHFRLLQTPDDFDEEAMDRVFDSIVNEAESLLYNLTILFVSEGDHVAFRDIACRTMDDIATKDAGYAELGEFYSTDVFTVYENISYALIDKETWRIIDFDPVNYSSQ